MMKTYVMIPTYNEKENIRQLIEGILSLKIKNLHIVVVDDNSPDRTHEIVKKMSQKNKSVHLLLRTGDRGRGAAGKAGFIYCLDNAADIVIEMDGDLSHQPKYIPAFLEEIKRHDVVLGSRRVKGSKDIGRSAIRVLITLMANIYIRLILGLKVKDCNSGYRCFRRVVLEKTVYSLESIGPAIVQELLFKAHLKGFRIKEIPIVFVNRAKGASKLGLKQLVAGYLMVIKLKAKHVMGMI